MNHGAACLIGATASLFIAHGALGQAQVNQPAVRVYDATQISLTNYTIIKRLWVESWRSSLQVPRYGSPAQGTMALSEAAASLGADGLVNVSCVPNRGGFPALGGFYCYGEAIRLKKR